MNYYLERYGKIEGPHSLDELKSMHSKGLLSSSIMVAASGDPDWKPLHELIVPVNPTSGPPPLPRQAPPSLPQSGPGQALQSALTTPMVIDGKQVPGTFGKTAAQIVEEVKKGGRFVVFHYAFSLVLVSFRRTTGISYVAPGASGASQAFGPSLTSILFGWWGIPWGVIYTIGSLLKNAFGGTDVTEPVLANIVGPTTANALVNGRPQPKRGALIGLHALILGMPMAVLIALISIGISSDNRHEDAMRKVPGYAQYQKADTWVKAIGRTISHGNTPAASQAAKRMSEVLAAIRNVTIESSKDSSSDSDKFVVWCQNHNNHCTFLIKVPQLRRYTGDAKDTIALACWMAAERFAGDLLLKRGATVSVALRGDYVYDRLLTGTFPSRQADKQTDTLPADVKVTTGSNFDEALSPLFTD